MSWTGKKVLVTGACGFIGSHLAEALVKAGADVRAMVQYNATGSRGWLDDSDLAADMEIIAGDIRDPWFCVQSARGADTVFHLAALIAIPYSYIAPASYVRTNVEGTLNVLEAAKAADVRRVVHTSTSEVYGTALRVPIDETHPLQGQSPYSASKIGADKIAESYHLSFELPVCILRPFNTYGPRQSARAVIPTIISQCLAGAGVKLGNLSPTRDFTYVDDTVAGFMKIATCDAAIGRTVNLGCGKEISIGDLSRLIASLTGVEESVMQDGQRFRPPASEVERLLSDNSQAAELMDWSPAVDLNDGLSRTIRWIGDNLQKYRPADYVV